MEEMETEYMDAECVYCVATTTWLVEKIADDWLRFECTKCCKISRDLHLAS